MSDGNPKRVTRRPEEMPSVPQKPNPQGIAFIIGRTQACNLEIHCTIAPAEMHCKISVALLRGFFGNLIFAIIGRILGGNHPK